MLPDTKAQVLIKGHNDKVFEEDTLAQCRLVVPVLKKLDDQVSGPLSCRIRFMMSFSISSLQGPKAVVRHISGQCKSHQCRRKRIKLVFFKLVLILFVFNYWTMSPK